jgi:CubicO group peptidase (beta-lactamase class C family)
VADGAAPSVAVAVARDGQILWSDAQGFADRDARIPATADTPYSVASLTKPFTATAS